MRNRTLSFMLIICMVMSFFMPFTAFAAAPDTSTPLGESGASDSSCETPDGVSLRSGWEGGGTEFFTRIRLTAIDRNSNPIEGAVYGLYRASDDSLVAYITTNSYGVAESSDVPIDTDYYLLEYSTPLGYLPNEERKDIVLTDFCAPSRIDVTVIYDDIMGKIKVIKTGENGVLLADVTFFVYDDDTGEHLDTITTNNQGIAITTDLPYGYYHLYEYSAPDGYETGAYALAVISEHEKTVELSIRNYLIRGNVYLHKSGNDGKNIQGAVFSIYTQANEWVEDITTSASGYTYSSSLSLGDYYLVEKSVPDGYVLDTTKHEFTLNQSNTYFSIDLTNNRAGDNGKLRIIKTDDSNNPLSGVVFALYRAWDGKKMGELTTGADGTAISALLIPDSYYLVETVGKPGYTQASGQIAFTIDGSGSTVELPVENPKIRIFGKVKVIKKDDAGTPISGVKFGVYCDFGNLLEEMTTDSNGEATSGILNEGDGYYLKELEAVSGYLSDAKTRYPFDISENGVVVPIQVVNPRISGRVKVLKTGENETTPLSGVTFGVYRAGTEDIVFKLTTGEDGTATSDTLFYGDYELRELITVEGYEKINTPIPFSISEQDVVIEIPVSNPLILGGVRVVKVDADTPDVDETPSFVLLKNILPIGPSPMAGAVFGIYNGKGQKIAELITGDDGTASYDGLPMGNYYLKELTAPEGYVVMEDMIPFAISEQGEIVEKTIPNAQGFGLVEITKTGEGNEVLAGVVFELFRVADDTLLMEITTGEEGTLTQELPLGRYYLKEKSTTIGYRLLSGTISFVLTEQGKVVTLSIVNQKEPVAEDGKIKIIKKDEMDGALLSGAVFGVYSVSDDEKMAELITDKDGAAVSPALPEGAYYLKEITAPIGYERSTTKTDIAVKKTETMTVTLTNKKIPLPTTGYLLLTKKEDGSGKKLSSAVFGLYRSANDEKICELKTGSNGTIKSPALPSGNYYLKEIKAPSGFALSGDKTSVHIKAGETVEITVTNFPESIKTGRVKIIKTSAVSSDKLEGAVFGIYKADNDEKMAEIITENDGEATSPSLPAGDYYLKELKAPAGYKLSSEKVRFNIKADEAIEVAVKNEKLADFKTGTLIIIKKAERTGKLLPDAVFGVYTNNNQKVMELTTADDGTASGELAPGSYYLRELRAPTMYVAEQSKIPFSIKTAATVRVEITNTQGHGTVKLVKLDDAGKPLSGGVFTLHKQDGTQIAQLTSRNDGTALYELSIGSYYLVEKTAPAGFALDTTRREFTVKHGETSEVRVLNKPLEGEVIVYFKHLSDGRELAPMKTYTDKVGADYIKWMRANGYENMPINGFNLIRTDYQSSFVLIDGKLVVALWYDSPASTGGINIPKTGETPPYANYGLGALFLSISGVCGMLLYRMKKKGKKRRAG